MTGSVEFIRHAPVEIANACKCVAHLVHAAADAGQRIQHGFGSGAMGSEMRTALGRYVVELSRTLMLDACVADLLEESQCRIDHAGARAVEAAGAFFDRLDELVAMARAFFEQREDKKLKVRRTKSARARQVSAARTTEKPTAAMAESMPPAARSDGVEERFDIANKEEMIVKHILRYI